MMLGLIFNSIQITVFPHIVSAHLCTVTFGLMYCDLWISKFKKEYFPRKLYEEIRYIQRKHDFINCKPLLMLPISVTESNQQGNELAKLLLTSGRND